MSIHLLQVIEVTKMDGNEMGDNEGDKVLSTWHGGRLWGILSYLDTNVVSAITNLFISSLTLFLKKKNLYKLSLYFIVIVFIYIQLIYWNTFQFSIK